ncbi:MAG: co-chaperone GroES [Patescibacteria group bacterium]|nr:co-chaperone GroES [Patescibacteria group bacterium]
MNLKPLTDHLLVKPIKKETAKGGLVLPATGQEKPETGEVVAVGPGRILDNGTRLEMTLKVGDKIMFKKYAPDEIKVEDQEYLIISESEVLAIIN